MTDSLFYSPPLAGDAICAIPAKDQLARFDIHWMKSSVAIVSAHGNIDRTNAHTLAKYSLAELVRCHGLILDLTHLRFFGVEGVSALHKISLRCARWNGLGVGTW